LKLEAPASMLADADKEELHLTQREVKANRRLAVFSLPEIR
jgi:hypothetical protein